MVDSGNSCFASFACLFLPTKFHKIVCYLQKELISGDQNGNIRVWDLAANSCSCELVSHILIPVLWYYCGKGNAKKTIDVLVPTF